jgi:hypothetical protein
MASAVPFDAAGAAAKLFGRFEQRHRYAVIGQFDGAGDAGPAAADNGDLVSCHAVLIP